MNTFRKEIGCWNLLAAMLLIFTPVLLTGCNVGGGQSENGNSQSVTRGNQESNAGQQQDENRLIEEEIGTRNEALEPVSFAHFRENVLGGIDSDIGDSNSTIRIVNSVLHFPNGIVIDSEGTKSFFVSTSAKMVGILNSSEGSLTVVNSEGNEVAATAASTEGYGGIFVTKNDLITLSPVLEAARPGISFYNYNSRRQTIMDADWRSCGVANLHDYVAITTNSPSYFVIYTSLGEEVWRHKISDNPYFGEQGYSIVFSRDDRYIAVKAPRFSREALPFYKNIEGKNKIYFFDTFEHRLITEEALASE